MPELASWANSVVWPGLLALVAVAGAALARRTRRGVLAALMCASALAYLVVIRSRVTDLADVPASEPWWFVVTVGMTAASVAAATMALANRGRAGEGAILTGVGVGAAAGAVPDVEVAIGVAALWLPLLLLGPLLVTTGAGMGAAQPGPGADSDRSAGWWVGPLPAVVGVLVGVLAGLAMADGAAGRPGTVLIAPAVVAPLVLSAVFPAPRSVGGLVSRIAVAGLVVVLVARHAGLGDGTARPSIGSLAGLATLTALALVADITLGRADHEEARQLRTPRGLRG